MVNLHLEVLTPEGLSLWNRLDKAMPILEKCYLAGGTALALQLGHRKSIDFDFFTIQNIAPNSHLTFGKRTNSKVIPLNLSSSSLEFLSDNVKVMIWEYHFPLLEKLINYNGLNLASAKSIGLFKLIALEARTTWKDIVDLYFIHTHICPLSEILSEYCKCLPKEFESFYSNIKNLFNHEDLLKSPTPDMLHTIDFETTLQTVKQEIINYFKII